MSFTLLCSAFMIKPRHFIVCLGRPTSDCFLSLQFPFYNALLSISTLCFKSSLMSWPALLSLSRKLTEFSSLLTISSFCGFHTDFVICGWFVSVAAWGLCASVVIQLNFIGICTDSTLSSTTTRVAWCNKSEDMAK